MTANQIKRRVKQWLPRAVFEFIQKIRVRGYQPPPEALALKRAFEERQSVCQSEDQIALRDDVVLRIDPQSREPFEWFCWRSMPMAAEMDEFIERARGAKTFADVGANHGIFSLVFLRVNPEGHVISVDPSPIAGEIRRRNRELNGMEAAMSLHDVACGSAAGNVRMHFNWHHLEVVGAGQHREDDVDVKVKTLDELCARDGLQPDLVKIDVEGFELEVLKGAERALAAARLLFLEIHPELLDQLKCPPSEIYQWLTERGWTVRSLEGRAFDAATFADQIHTFWTVCEKAA
ncbi:MAG TPA: FkbM family methyltransferase [Prosthecobacter sp.]|nr:FkbM family methyltransferase [Prosthecobacter sp.]